MTDFILVRPSSAVGWELRGALGSQRVVRLTLSDRCDGVAPNADGQRILEGRVTSVSPTDAYAIIADRHVPLDDVLSVTKPHFTQADASDPTDPLDRPGDYTDAPLA